MATGPGTISMMVDPGSELMTWPGYLFSWSVLRSSRRGGCMYAHQAEVELEDGRLHARAAAVGLVAALAALGREAHALARLEVA